MSSTPPPHKPPEDPSDQVDDDIDDDTDSTPPCVLVFNANDPSGAGGLAADMGAIASVGGHALPVVCGAYTRDSGQIHDHVAFDEDAVTDQARAVLEDMPVQVIKVGFAGSPANLGAIAEIATDYDEVPLVAYMPDLSWWGESEIEEYLDAFRELVLPQTTVLVGNHSTLWRWLLPDWSGTRNPTARDIARAAAESGVPYTLVTGIALPEQFVDNVLASPTAVLGTAKYELFDAVFSGAGDTLSAALSALLATGTDLGEATSEALGYLDRALDAGFRPGMGHVLPDRLFWAQGSDDGEADPDEDDDPDQPSLAVDPAAPDTPSIEGFVMPPHDTKH